LLKILHRNSFSTEISVLGLFLCYELVVSQKLCIFTLPFFPHFNVSEEDLKARRPSFLRRIFGRKRW